jgi:uncharacterized LabA/DUF88 family protein
MVCLIREPSNLVLTSSRRESSKENSLGLTAEDWSIILRGAKRLVVRKDAVIISQNSDFQRIFQVVRGNCRIQVVRPSPSLAEELLSLQL